MKKVLLVLWVFVLASPLFSEVHIWKDKSGNSYEAEYVRELFDKVTLRTTDGKEIRIAIEELSELDQRYLRVMVPPRFSIQFRKKSEVKEKPPELWATKDITTVIGGVLTIHKESKRLFTSGMTAEIFLIAEELDGDNYVLLSKTKSHFLLVEQNDNMFVLKTHLVEPRRYWDDSELLRGEEYTGYLVVVSDARGNILQTKTDIPRGWIEQPEVIENLRKLAIVGAPSIRSRHFDKTGLKADVPRPMYYLPDNR